MPNVELDRVTKVDRRKMKEDKQMTKVVVRHLPPCMTLESFLDLVDVPSHDYISYGPADKTLMPQCTSRVYINFLHIEDLLIFTQKFDGYVFLDNKGHEYQAIVEFAPFQRIAKSKSCSSKKKNTKCGTIESDPYFIEFKENLAEEREKAGSCTFKQHYFETNTENGEKNKITDTPLLQYLRNKTVEKAKTRDEKREEKKQKEVERKKMKEEQQNLRRAQIRKVEQEAHSNTIYIDGPYANKRDVFSRRKQVERRKTGKDNDTPSKNQTSKSKLTLKGAIVQREKSLDSQESRDTKNLQPPKEVTSASVVPAFQDPAIIEMRLASDNSKSNMRYTRQESNSQQDKRQRLKEDNKKIKSTDIKFNKNKEKSNSKEGRNREKSDRFFKNKFSETDYKNKAKQGEEVKYSEYKSCDDVKKGNLPSFSKPNTSPNKYDDKKRVPKKSENFVDNNNSRRTDKFNKVTNKSDPKTPIKTNMDTNKIDTKSSAKSNNVVDSVDVKETERFSKSRDRVEKSNKINSFPDKTLGKSNSKVNDRSKSDNINSDEKMNHSKSKTKSDNDNSKIQLAHNVLQRRKSLEDKQMEKYFESGRRNSLDSKKKTDDDEDCRDPRPERRIRNKDRPSIAIYRPGMGRFSKQRIGNDSTENSTEQDSHSHSPSPTHMSKVGS